MAAITVAPFVLSNVALTVGTDNYEAHVSKVQFDPSSSVVNWKGLTPTQVNSFGTSPTWTVTLEYAQDWATTNSLSQYLLANANTQKTMTFKPIKPATGTTYTVTATVIVQPGPIGGAVDNVATGSVTLGVVGTPTTAVV